MVVHETLAWKFSKDTHEQHVDENRIWWGEDGNAKYPRLKIYRGDNGLVPIDVWHWQQTGTSDEGGSVLKEIFGSAVFENPKPVRLVRRILQLATNSDSNDIVLDSCAGSGTTAHAVLEQNLEDGGNRAVILVQQPFDTKEDESVGRNIASTITAERVRRVALGYSRLDQAASGERIAGLGGSFTYGRVGEPLFSEYRDFGKNLPDWEILARYIFYTETSRDADAKKFNAKTGYIGATEAAGGTSYYLLYSPDNDVNTHVSLRTLPDILKKDKNKTLVIYAERVWLHGDELAKFEAEHGRKIRPMVVPFGLR
jgi:hypothetical protein